MSQDRGFDDLANKASHDFEKTKEGLVNSAKVEYGEDLANKASHDFEKTKEGLVNSAKVEYGEDSASVYGIRFPKAFGPAVDWATSIFVPGIIHSATDYAEVGTRKAVLAITKDSGKAELAGNIAKKGVFFGLVFAKLLGKGWRVLKDHWDARSDIYEQFRPIAQATGVNATTNGVMKLEYNYIYNQSLSKAGKLWVEIPEAVATAVVTHEKMLPADAPRGRIGRWLSNSDDKMVMAGVGAVKQGLQLWAEDKEKKVADDSRHMRPLEMIQRLDHYVNELRGPSRNGTCDFEEIEPRYVSAIKNKVIAIFQRYESDMEAARRSAGKPYMHHGEITGAGNVKALNDVSQLIAEAIANGTIDTRALVSLIGDEKVISHTREKRTINIDVAITQIAELRDKLGTCAAPDPKEFFAHFDSPEAMKDTLKTLLNEMQGVEKACFASLFSDPVLKAAGMKQEEITAVRKEAHSHMYKLVADNVRELAGKSQEELTKLQVKEEDIDTLLELSDRIDRGDKKALKSLVDGRGRVLLQNIMGVAVLQELQTDKNAWTDRMKARPETRRRTDAHEEVDPHEEETMAYRKAHNGLHPNGEDVAVDREGWTDREQSKRRVSHEEPEEDVSGDEETPHRKRVSSHRKSTSARRREEARRFEKDSSEKGRTL